MFPSHSSVAPSSQQIQNRNQNQNHTATGSASAAAAVSMPSVSGSGSQSVSVPVSLKRKFDSSRSSYLSSMADFWSSQLSQVDAIDFRSPVHSELPLARIKKIMKCDEEIRMIAAESPILFSKACELFVFDLTMRAWAHTDLHSRRTLQRCDVAEAIAECETFDFLLELIPKEEQNSGEIIGTAQIIELHNNNEGNQSQSQNRQQNQNDQPHDSHQPIQQANQPDQQIVK